MLQEKVARDLVNFLASEENVDHDVGGLHLTLCRDNLGRRSSRSWSRDLSRGMSGTLI